MIGASVFVLAAGLALVPAAHAQGPPAGIVLSLQPPSIPADGSSTSTATATVTDGTGTGVPGETVTFSSSDSGETISATTDHGDGTYTATITSSTTVGTSTITASDTAANLSNQQTLTQTTGAPTHIALSLQPSSIAADGHSTSLATATVTDGSGRGVAGEAVLFSSTDAGETISATTDHGDGTYTATITSSTTVGTSTITASDTPANLSNQQTLTQTTGAPTHIALSLQPPSIPADGSSTSTASATVTDSAGHGIPGEPVTFSSSDAGETISATVDHGGGLYTATITSSTTVGAPTIRAHDGGLVSAPQALIQTVGAPASISLSLRPSSIVADGHSSSLATATVMDRTGHGVPGQAVVFSSTDHGETISSVSDHGNGQYSATITSSTTAGQASITARVDGIASAPQTLSQIPGRAAKITLTLQPPVVASDGISLATAIATLSDAFGNPVAGDTLQFSSSNQADRIFVQPPSGNVYTASIISSTHPGSSTITASDSTVGISVQQTLKEVAGTSATSLVISPASPVSTNEGLTLLATVSGSGGSPSGTVQFIHGFLPIPGCTSLPVTASNTVAICQTSFAASQSPVQISAVFTPDSASSVAGSSTSGTFSVGPGSTSTTLGGSSPTVTVGTDETYTAFVSAANQGAAAPTGSVKFQDGGKTLPGCDSVPVRASAGAITASCSAMYSRLGTRRVTAVYSGDQNFRGSTSSLLRVPVLAQGLITASMLWNFRHTSTYTRVAQLTVDGLSLGNNVIITCRGHGCPFARRTIVLSGGIRCTPARKRHCGPHSKGPFDLTGAFRKHRLAVGTRFTVEILRPGWIGKFFGFMVRPNRVPQVRISCLSPGLSKPGVSC